MTHRALGGHLLWRMARARSGLLSRHRRWTPRVLLLAWALGLGASAASAVEITATWTGGTDEWDEPSAWSFSSPPASALFPDNDAQDTFDVRIDGGSTADSTARLGLDVTIRSLDVSSGDRLQIADGAGLGFGGLGGSTADAAIANQGEIQLVDGASGAWLGGAAALSFSGSGTLDLGELGNSRVGFAGTLLNAADHTIRGAGTLENLGGPFDPVVNEGTLHQTGAGALVVPGRIINEGELRATGSGGLVLRDRVTNDGLLEVLEGSSLVSTRVSGAAQGLVNRGEVRFVGAGTMASFEDVSALGDLQVLDGAFAQFDRGPSSGGLASDRLLVRDAEVGLPRFFRTRGTTTLDEGTLSVDRSATFNGRLQGSGSVEFLDPDLGSGLQGVLAPGIDGAGVIDVDGRIDLTEGRFEVDLLGTAPSSHDRLTATGSLALGDRVAFRVADPIGFSPSVGDRFDIIEAGLVTETEPTLQPLFDMPTLSEPDTYLVARIRENGSGETLALGIAEPVRASWRGGVGDYRTPGSWSFSQPPVAATAPVNDLASIFDVVIADAPGAVATTDEDLPIGSLRIGEENTLDVTGASTVLLEFFGDRPENGQIEVDGLLRLGEGARLLSDGDLELSGSGRVELGDSPGSQIGASLEPMRVTIGEGITVAGAGSLAVRSFSPSGIQDDRVLNRGVIEATGENFLVVAEGRNEGTMRAIGAGGLRVGDVDNEGTIQVGPGSSLETALLKEIENRGRIELEGTGATASIRLQNLGETEVSGGASLDLVSFDQSGNGSLTLRDTTANIAFLSPPGFNGGTVHLDDATLTVRQNSPIEIQRTRLEGTGRWVVERRGIGTDLQIENFSTIAPGTIAEAGLLEFDASVELTANWELDVFGADPGDYDAVRVTEGFEFGSSARSILGFGGGYTPMAGDAFELLRAEAIAGFTDSVAARFTLPALDGLGLFYELGVEDGINEDTLRLAIEAPIRATWAGGVGSYEDESRWIFDVPPETTPIPDGSGGELFDVFIDGGNRQASSVVGLDRSVSIFRMTVDEEDSLVLGPEGAVELLAPLGNARSGGVQADGVVRLEGGRLGSERTLELRGRGLLELADVPGSSIEVTGSPSLDIGEDFTVRGSGTVEGASVLNDGLVEAIGSGGLVFTNGASPFTFLNQGQLRIAGGSRLGMLGTLDSSGGVRVDPGGSLEIERRSGFGLLGGIQNDGLFSLGGSVTSDRVENRGSFVIDAGGTLIAPFSYTQTSSSARTEVAGSVRGPVQLDAGSFVLTGGSVDAGASSGLFVGRRATLGGEGRIDIGVRSRIAGALSPGLGGFGELEFTGDILLLENAQLDVEVGETAGSLDSDLIRSMGTVGLAGILAVRILDGYTPELNDSFDVLVASIIEDNGFDVVAPELGEGLGWVASIVSGPDDDRLRLRVVPEPATALLVALGLAGLASRRARRNRAVRA